MSKTYIFDMINRTVGEQLPDCTFFDYEENTGYRIEFHGSLDELSGIPLRLDLIVDNTVLIGDARQKELCKNSHQYVAVYYAYAVHRFKDKVPVWP